MNSIEFELCLKFRDNLGRLYAIYDMSFRNG